MDNIHCKFNFGKAHKCLLQYYESKDIRHFSGFVGNGARRFIILIAKKKFKEFKKEIVRDLEQEVANIVLLRLMKPRKEPIISMKSYLYTAAINASYDIIKKYRLYEHEMQTSLGDREYQIESPEDIVDEIQTMEISCERLLYYFTQLMEPKLMSSHQACVFIEFLKGYSCKEIAQNMPDRKLETIKSDLRDARRILKTNCIRREDILKVLENTVT